MIAIPGAFSSEKYSLSASSKFVVVDKAALEEKIEDDNDIGIGSCGGCGGCGGFGGHGGWCKYVN